MLKEPGVGSGKISEGEAAILAELLWLRKHVEALLPLVERYTNNPAARFRRRNGRERDRDPGTAA